MLRIKRYKISEILLYCLYYGIAYHLPQRDRWMLLGRISYNFRRGICRRLFKKTGNVFGVGKGVDFEMDADKISMGERANLGDYARIISGGEVIFGNRIIMGPEVMFIAQDHIYNGKNYSKKTYKNIIIGDDVWIGARAIILNGVKIGDRATVGAGAVVAKDVPNDAVVAGNPAKVLRFRDQV